MTTAYAGTYVVWYLTCFNRSSYREGKGLQALQFFVLASNCLSHVTTEETEKVDKQGNSSSDTRNQWGRVLHVHALENNSEVDSTDNGDNI